jgi:hypothetical protein
MKKSTKGLVVIVCLFAGMVALNFFFFVDNRTANETEFSGNRSSYLPTHYGTLAYYTLLQKAGVPVQRFTHDYTELKDYKNIHTFIVVSPPAGESKEELASINEWVQNGGYLILIDRQIDLDFSHDVKITTESSKGGYIDAPLQPTPFTQGVQRVTASTQYASDVTITGPDAVAHIGNNKGAILADTKVGRGRVVALGDPFIVANNGISQDDNAALALNLVRERPQGDVAFDEFHHGYGSEGIFSSGGLMGYFNGTPVPWMMAQIGLIALMLIYSQGRRFGRPLPLKHEKRTTNLEFVASMATITRIARATDLAMQNIYWEFFRQLCRYCGLPSNTSFAKLASVASRRSGIAENELMEVLIRCSQVASGYTVSDSEMLSLVTEVRAIESKLKL